MYCSPGNDILISFFKKFRQALAFQRLITFFSFFLFWTPLKPKEWWESDILSLPELSGAISTVADSPQVDCFPFFSSISTLLLTLLCKVTFSSCLLVKWSSSDSSLDVLFLKKNLTCFYHPVNPSISEGGGMPCLEKWSTGIEGLQKFSPSLKPSIMKS